MDKPGNKPQNPNFSSGPCAKRPGWSLEALQDALIGRSHRSGPGKKKLQEVIDRNRALLGIPDDYRIAIVPASDTGAVEMALWNLLGERGVDVLAWESFSSDWAKDIQDHLAIDNARLLDAEYGKLPDLAAVNFQNDVVFVWNGTTSGVMVPDGNWIPDDRQGLTICDATSAIFAYDLPWNKLDVVTWSWQKVLGGEAAHGMLVLSPRAVERLRNFKPQRPLPKIFRMMKKGDINEGLFKGETLNTPSMIAVEDCLDTLRWVEGLGGLQATTKRTQENFQVLEKWVQGTDWIEFLAGDANSRSRTSVCLQFVDSWFTEQSVDDQAATIGALCKLLDKEGVAYDIKGYRSAPAGLRIWAGATIESSDLEKLCPWIEWAYAQTKEELVQKAA